MTAKPRRKKKTPPLIPSPDAEWLVKRAKDLGMSQRQLAKAIGVDAGAFAKTTRGDRQVRPNELAGLARMLKVSIAEMFRRFRYPVPEYMVEIIGKITPDARVSSVFDRKGEMVPAPDGVDTDCKALVFVTGKSPLEAYDGMVVYFYPSNQVEQDAYGRLSVVEIEGEAMPVVGIIERGQVGKGLKVALFGGVGTIEAKKLLKAALIKWTKAS